MKLASVRVEAIESLSTRGPTSRLVIFIALIELGRGKVGLLNRSLQAFDHLLQAHDDSILLLDGLSTDSKIGLKRPILLGEPPNFIHESLIVLLQALD